LLDPCHYIRLQPLGGKDLLIIGGEDHKSGQASDSHERYARLESWSRQRFPMIRQVQFAWQVVRAGKTCHADAGGA